MSSSRFSTRKALAALSIVSAAAILLTGCGSSSGSASSKADASATAIPKVSLSNVTKDAALAARLPESIKSSGTLTIGSDTTFPPAEFMAGADGNTAVGYDVDLAKALGKKLGVKIKFESASFDGILPALGSKYDLGISAFYITKERLQAVNMVSYTEGGSTLLVAKGNPKKLTLKNLCGHKIAVQIGSTQQGDLKGFSKACTDAGKKKISALPLKTNTDAVTRLKAGVVDAVLSGQSMLGYTARLSGGSLQTLKESYSQAPSGIAVAKDDTAFAQLVADTVNSLIKDGTYAKVMKAWGQNSSMIDTAQVNPKTVL
ncbi:MAG: ABC transporter substrate-binding protein [Microbacteriaceae bacterium]|jgi:polar amino acid transport system substrate-binding protein|nr:ABC transporter substrate-binding protein [Microbacteriaceae bacterium]MCI1207417.1 ABC transporter substrate-binding protein [Microbacteriaceae bacterium]